MYAKEITWNYPLYPSCQSLDLLNYFDMYNSTPLQLFFDFKKLENIGISLFVKERNKALKSRPLKSSMLNYLGVELLNEDLNKTIYLTTILTSTQTLDSEEEEDKKCKIYPYGGYQNFTECDENFVYEKMKNYYRYLCKKF